MEIGNNATRLDFDLDKVDLNFNYKSITYGEIKQGNEKISNGKINFALKQRFPHEKVSETLLRIYSKETCLAHRIAFENKVYPTMTAGHDEVWTESGNHPSDIDLIHLSTFPEDYDFCEIKNVSYICGISVPPIMIKRIVTRLIESGIFEKEEI